MSLPPNFTPEVEALMREKIAERLATNPPDPTAYPFGLVVGMTFDEPDPGWVVAPCDHCEEAIVIGPAQQRVMSLNAFLRALCMPCVFTLAALGYDFGEARDARDVAPRPEG